MVVGVDPVCCSTLSAMRLPRLSYSRRSRSGSLPGDRADNTRTLPAESAPRAQRLRSSRWGDARLWIGIVLLVASMFAGARLLSQDAETITVWQAARDLSAGATVQDLRPVTVALGSAEADYVPVDEQPTGRLRYPLAAGELLARSALGNGGELPTRIITVGVDPLHAPVDLAPGERVDVWATPADTTFVENPTLVQAVGTGPRLALESVLVEHVGSDALGGQVAVVLRVQPDQVADIVSATRSGSIDLVKIPVPEVRS